MTRFSVPANHWAIPHIRAGERIAIEIDGKLYTDTVTSYTQTAPIPPTYPQHSRIWWILRRLTPRRWRKPIKPIHPGQPSQAIITTGTTGAEGDPVARMAKNLGDLEQAGQILDGLIHTEPLADPSTRQPDQPH